jgi:hypothetical protein
MVWHNDDGLVVRFGTERTEKAKVAEYTTDGDRRFLEVVLLWSDLPAVADGVTIISEEVRLPDGAWVEEVELVVTTEFDSAADGATLNIGTIDLDRSSNGDTDGFVVAATEGELAVGQTSNVAGWVGDHVDGPALTSPKLITVEVDGEAFTAGEGVARIWYIMPVLSSDTLIQS